MKRIALYNTLQLLQPEDQPDVDIRNFLERMAQGEIFRFAVLHLTDEGKNAKTLRCPQDIDFIIEQMRVTDAFGELSIVGKTLGVLPPGFKHGKYTMTCGHGQFIDDLPEEMFNNEEAPPDELEDWVEEVVENAA